MSKDWTENVGLGQIIEDHYYQAKETVENC